MQCFYTSKRNESCLLKNFNYNYISLKCLCANKLNYQRNNANAYLHFQIQNLSLQFKKCQQSIRNSAIHLQRCEKMPTQYHFYHHRPKWSFKNWNEWNRLLHFIHKWSNISSLFQAMLPKSQKNANFRNSKSCRIFDEVRTYQNPNQPVITIMQKIAIVANDPEHHQNAMKCHEIINLSAVTLLRRLLT